jgi:hypothetical protein
MLNTIAIFALALSALNWLLFLMITFLNDIPMLEKLLHHLAAAQPERTERVLGTHGLQAIDLSKVLTSTGSLAGAFKKAGSAPTAAAMSMMCLVIAAAAAGLNKI